MGILSGKTGVVFGVANKRSIAWAIAQAWKEAGADLAFTYQGERLKDNVSQLAETFGDDTLITECDVTQDDHIDRVFNEVGDKFGGKLDLMLHAVAFAGLALLLMLAVPMACCYRGRVAIVAVVSLYGLVDEATQPMVGRSFMFSDLGADVAGAVVGVFCGWVVAARRR